MVSADFRRPRLEEIFGLPAGRPPRAGRSDQGQLEDAGAGRQPARTRSQRARCPGGRPSGRRRRRASASAATGRRERAGPARHARAGPATGPAVVSARQARRSPPTWSDSGIWGLQILPGRDPAGQSGRALRQPGHAAGDRPAAAVGRRHPAGHPAGAGRPGHGHHRQPHPRGHGGGRRRARPTAPTSSGPCNRLEATNCRVLGVVLNRVRRAASDGYQAYDYTAMSSPGRCRTPARRDRLGGQPGVGVTPPAGPERPPTRPTWPPYVVVVAYGAPGLLDACLGSPGRRARRWWWWTTPPARRAEVCTGHGAEYVDPGRNLGFAGGVNLGVGDAGSTGRRRRGRRRAAAQSRRRHRAGRGGRDSTAACGADPRPGLRGTPAQHDRVDGGGDARVGWPFPTPAGAWLEAVGLGRLRRRVDFLIGSVSCWCGRAAWPTSGGFDEQYFLYAEETDWQRRAADRGWRVALCPDVTAIHVGAGTGGDPAVRETHFQASHERYVRKHHGRRGLVGPTGLAGPGRRRPSGPWCCPGPGAAAPPLRFRLYRPGPCRVEAELMSTGRPRPARGPRRGHRRLRRGGALRLPGGQRSWAPGATGSTPSAATRNGCGPSCPRPWCHRPAAPPAARRGRALAAVPGDVDLVHVHMTAAEGGAWLARPIDGPPWSPPGTSPPERGSSPCNRALARMTSRSIALDIAISRVRGRRHPGPPVLIPNGVPRPAAGRAGAPHRRHAAAARRREGPRPRPPGLRRASGLAERGWELVVAGPGQLRPRARSWSASSACTGDVTFVGQVADTDRLLAASSILLAPGPGRAVRPVGGRGHGPRPARGGGGRRRPPRDGRRPTGLLFPPGRRRGAARRAGPAGRRPGPPARGRGGPSAAASRSATRSRSTWTGSECALPTDTVRTSAPPVRSRRDSPVGPDYGGRHGGGPD